MDLFLLWGLQRLSLSVILEPRFKKKGEDRGIIYHELLSTANMKKDKETRALRCELETYRRPHVAIGMYNRGPEQGKTLGVSGLFPNPAVKFSRISYY